ncbi:hypothetical protein Taro_040650 [Colocasia esculenta]|uniref:Uncharacterized protein n=1 Tax=Colocasia esculenta TaxID=4460 RepID=A0A843WTM7_COLES|nr:hypothetical protein [Colocasia esculenta]
MNLSLGSPKKPPKHHSFGFLSYGFSPLFKESRELFWCRRGMVYRRRGLGYPGGVMGWPDRRWGHLPNGWACLPPEFRDLQRMQVRDINDHIHGR